jgi:hypothetical protein
MMFIKVCGDSCGYLLSLFLLKKTGRSFMNGIGLSQSCVWPRSASLSAPPPGRHWHGGHHDSHRRRSHKPLDSDPAGPGSELERLNDPAQPRLGSQVLKKNLNWPGLRVRVNFERFTNLGYAAVQ